MLYHQETITYFRERLATFSPHRKEIQAKQEHLYEKLVDFCETRLGFAKRIPDSAEKPSLNRPLKSGPK